METVVWTATLGPIFAAGGGLVTTRSPEQWLFVYDDPLLSFLKANLDPTIDPSGNFFENPPLGTPVDPADASTVMTGGDDLDNLNQYVNWRGMTQVTGVWLTNETITGTDATQFHPGVKSSETLKAFVSDLLRVVDLEYQKDRKFEGIDLLRFVLSEDTLATNPNYFQSVVGLANMTSAVGAPLFLSKPHFLDADPAQTSSLVTGMAGVVADHDTFVDIEPLTGAVMSARKRLQLNFQVSHYDYKNTDIPSNYMPILWVEEAGDIPADLANDFKETVYGAQRLEQVSQIGGPAVGVLLILSAMVMAVRMRKP
jgi:lysosome membrane protein 2